MKADNKRDILRKTILEFLTKSDLHYTDMEKKMCAVCYPFASRNTFNSQLRYLLDNNHVHRISRGIYQITIKGKSYLALLDS
jgi:hypothetical protein